MKSSVFAGLLLLTIFAAKNVNSQQVEGVPTLDVVVDKQSYAIGEPIRLTYTLKNPGERQYLLLNAQALSYPSLLLVVTSPSGEPLISLSERGHWSLTAPAPTLYLRPGSFYGMTVNLIEQFTQPYPMVNPHSLDTPGIYEITGIYENAREYDDEKRHDEARKLWMGRVASEPIKIEIKAPSPDQIKEIQRALREGDEAAKRRTVELIRKAKLREFLPQVAALLGSDASITLRQEAAGTLYELPDVKFYDTYIKQLKFPDATIRGYMALALGEKLKSKQAVPALIEVADPEIYPQSYKSALRALIEIGDPRGIPAIRKIAENDPSEAIRRYANDALQKLEAQTVK